MARKDSSSPPAERGFSDVIGILLIAGAFLLLLALYSFDRRDLSSTAVPPNSSPHNLIGPFGANIAHWLFFTFGGGAFLLPVLMLAFGLGYVFQFWAYLRQRWTWAAVLFVACLGLLGFYTTWGPLETLRHNLNAPNAGGIIGLLADKYVRGLFGRTGATIIFLTLYVISLLFLTNFGLGEWLRAQWVAFKERRAGDDADSSEEKALEKKAKELEKQAKKLQDHLEKTAKLEERDRLKAAARELKEARKDSKGAATAGAAPTPTDDEEEESSKTTGIGADLQPVPEPTIRDLSVPTARPPRAKKGEKETSPSIAPTPMLEGDIITATEIAAASTSDILGGNHALQKATSQALPVDAPAVSTSGADLEEKTSPDPDDEPLPLPLPAPAATRSKLPLKKPKPIAVAATPKIGNYQLPSIDFLQHPDPTVKPTESKEELMANARLMQSTLAQFDIEVALGDITKGPTITRYELHPAPGVRLEKIAALSNNIAAALKAERINILAPVPGKSSVGVEVPNAVKTKVIMRDLLESEEWLNTKARIPLALGKDVYGQPIIADLADMPHLLIAGSTGSGKSVCINSIIASLLYRFTPEQLRFVMIDPKVVELQQYNALPHLVVPVVNDPKKVILALRWVVNEMEKRYQIFAKVGVRNIKSFNDRPKDKPIPKAEPELPLMAKKEKVEAGQEGFAVELDEEIVVPRDEDIVIPEKLSYIVVIIDELADLMLVAPADVEMAIARITQMARAAGIHCIVATQRPSVDVITGVIKANIPARIAFQVAAKVDSRTILDAMGADKLLGKGDMLYLPPGSAKLIRAQGVLITDQEIQNVVDFIAQQAKPSYEVEIHQQLSKPVSRLDSEESGCDEDEDLIQQCIEVIRSEQKASVSLMQRRLRLGYTRAARIMDELENRGIVGPSKGAEPRDILIDLDAGEPQGAQQAS
jgi:S-DNA-T family DNA segregation ATPase FtsK/SpoIIIE